MVVHQISDESFLTDEISELETGFKCFSDLRTDTNTGTVLLFLEVIHDILMGLFYHRCIVMRTHTGSETEEEKTVKIVNFSNSSDS